MSTAYAADLPRQVVPVAAAPIFTWAGVYAGVNAGAAWRDDNDDRFDHNGSFDRPEKSIRRSRNPAA
jgi:hypothetical protein